MSKRIAYFQCGFCRHIFTARKDVIEHETDVHCLPQTFPCTLCEQRFETIETWEDHETKYHCQPQMTWFCMLDGNIEVHHCLFRSHYEEVHDLHPCNLSLDKRTFSTRYNITQHLVNVHQMTEDEISLIRDGVDIWSVKLNMGYNSGLWGCGYCGIVGADWDHRLIHIKNHWHDGGPRMTRKHPWSHLRTAKASVHGTIVREYQEDLRQGNPIKNRPTNMSFDGLEVYKAAMLHRGKRKADARRKDDLEGDLKKAPLRSHLNPAASFFSHLASRTKMFLSFARARRKRGQKEECWICVYTPVFGVSLLTLIYFNS